MKKILVTMIILVLALGLVACEPEKKEEQQGGQQTAPTSNNGNVEGSADSDSNKESGSKGGSSDFEAFAMAHSRAEFKVEYDFESSGAGQNMKGTFEMAQKGAKSKIKTDTQYGSGLIFHLDKVYSCSDTQGSMQCFVISSNQAQQDSAVETAEMARENPDGFIIEKANVIQIAGTSAQCFIVTSKKDAVELNICYESNGVPLYMSSKGSVEGVSFSSTMTATSYSTSVSNSEFDLPAEPTEIGGGLGAGSLPEGVELPEGVDISDYI